jgi:hypothetical protein
MPTGSKPRPQLVVNTGASAPPGRNFIAVIRSLPRISPAEWYASPHSSMKERRTERRRHHLGRLWSPNPRRPHSPIRKSTSRRDWCNRRWRGCHRPWVSASALSRDRPTRPGWVRPSRAWSGPRRYAISPHHRPGSGTWPWSRPAAASRPGCRSCPRTRIVSVPDRPAARNARPRPGRVRTRRWCSRTSKCGVTWVPGYRSMPQRAMRWPESGSEQSTPTTPPRMTSSV